MRTFQSSLLPIVAAIAFAGCEKPEVATPDPVDPRLITVDAAHLTLRHDKVGIGRFESKATFALVDAHNPTPQPLMITLAGVLTDPAGQEVGTLRPESLYVPPEGVRTFALIDDRNTERPTARGARVEVVGAHVAPHAPTVLIEDGGVYLDNDRVVVNGRVVNQADRLVKVIVIAGFYDADGAPMTRPFAVRQIGPGASQGVQFVGPVGSTKGYMFIGDHVY